MRVAAWFSTLWEFLKDLDTDYDPIEQLEVRVAALERAMTAASITTSPDDPMPPAPSSGAAPAPGRN